MFVCAFNFLVLACATTMSLSVAAAPFAQQKHTTFSDCADCPAMVVIPAGQFLMGSPQDEQGRDADPRTGDEDDTPGPGGNQVQVTVPRFALGAYEITHGQFRMFIEGSGYKATGGCIVVLAPGRPLQAEPEGRWDNKGRPNLDEEPAVCINWNMAVAYTRWLSERTGKRYRLPSEAEFEYALRAGSTTRYHFGDDQEDLCKYGNVPDASLRPYAPGR